MDLNPVKGTRDFLPQEKILRDEAQRKIRDVFERFGFNPLETPAMENWEVLASKYAGGDEILKETYKFSDRGERELGLRYDQTVPTCRVIANNPRMTMPFKRYQIQPVWRNGPLKVGRYREFTQCDADIFGVQSQSADAEIMAVIKEVLDSFGFDSYLKVNNRKVLDGILEYCGVEPEDSIPVILSLDKLEKIGAEEVQKELEGKGVGKNSAEKILKVFFELDGLGNAEVLEKLSRILTKGRGVAGIAELIELTGYLENLGVPTKSYVITPSLARGLAYYDSTIYEAFLREGPITSSLAGGGRYDEMVGKFSGSGKIPATGVGIGFEVICEVLKLQNRLGRSNVTEAFVIPIKVRDEAYEAFNELRKAGINSSIDLLGRSVSKNLEYCSKQAIPFAVIVGEKEAKEKKVTLRNLQTGKEELVGMAKAAAEILAARGQAGGK